MCYQWWNFCIVCDIKLLICGIEDYEHLIVMWGLKENLPSLRLEHHWTKLEKQHGTSEFGYMNTMCDSSVWVPVLRIEMSVYSTSPPLEWVSCCVSYHSWTVWLNASSLAFVFITPALAFVHWLSWSLRMGPHLVPTQEDGWLIRHREVWGNSCHLCRFLRSLSHWFLYSVLLKMIGESGWWFFSSRVSHLFLCWTHTPPCAQTLVCKSTHFIMQHESACRIKSQDYRWGACYFLLLSLNPLLPEALLGHRLRRQQHSFCLSSWLQALCPG